MPRQHRGPRVSTTVRLPPLLHGHLARIAARNHTSLNDIIVDVLRDYVEHELDVTIPETRKRPLIQTYDENMQPSEVI